ncbi:hypothetical protein CDV31_016439, partial [Fusarium ambrosium]
MPARLPNLDKLLDLLERYLALPGKPGLPGGKATKEELDFACRDLPVPAQSVGPGPWPSLLLLQRRRRRLARRPSCLLGGRVSLPPGPPSPSDLVLSP